MALESQNEARYTVSWQFRESLAHLFVLLNAISYHTITSLIKRNRVCNSFEMYTTIAAQSPPWIPLLCFAVFHVVFGDAAATLGDGPRPGRQMAIFELQSPFNYSLYIIAR